MPDITMCTNHECPMAKMCWRHEAPPNPFWQSWNRFLPYKIGRFDEIICDEFMEMRPLPDGGEKKKEEQ